MTIFDIKRYAINDGPGIRTTLFMKGCPLRCVWCHNPESWSAEPQELFKQSKCIRCGTCSQPGFTVDDCPTMAREICGRTYSMEQLMEEVEKERDIMEDSGGGVTLCGGEPLFQPEATLAVLKELGQRRLHRAVDTTLLASPDLIREVAQHCDLFLADLKLMDSEKHHRYTGVPNERILSNLRLLAELRTPFFIRIPLIEGINADEENIEATAVFLDSLPNHDGLRGINLLPYHDVGRDKHRRLCSSFNPEGIPMSVPSDAVLQRCIAQFAAHGYRATIGG